MSEFLVRTGDICAVVQAGDPVEAIQRCVAAIENDGQIVDMGTVTEVINLDECDFAKTYLNTQGTLTLLGYAENTPCGLTVTSTNVS